MASGRDEYGDGFEPSLNDGNTNRDYPPASYLAASRSVKDLLGSLETGASVAQESLESVGQAINNFSSSVWRGTAEIISHCEDAALSVDLNDGGDFETLNSGSSAVAGQSSKRFEAQVAGIQSDLVTYCDEPEDVEDYGKWNLGVVLEEKDEEIENLCSENGTVEAIYGKLVPSVVDHETFWTGSDIVFLPFSSPDY